MKNFLTSDWPGRIIAFICGFLVCFKACMPEVQHAETYETKQVQVELPEAEAEQLAGKPINDSLRRIIVTLRQVERTIDSMDDTTSASLRRIAAASILKMPAASVGPCPDLSFEVIDSIPWTFTQNVSTPDTSYLWRQDGKYYLKFVADCLAQKARFVAIRSTPIGAIVVSKHTTDVIVKMPWLRLSPYVETNAMNLAEWTGGIRLSVRFGDLWAYGAAETTLQKDLRLRVPVGVEYDLVKF